MICYHPPVGRLRPLHPFLFYTSQLILHASFHIEHYESSQYVGVTTDGLGRPYTRCSRTVGLGSGRDNQRFYHIILTCYDEGTEPERGDLYL
ncbi:hypothetical protein VDGD_20191 [Verticillium dahliae]|nr:hypothetical protein VDGD_20191 [Verticillium dahliae]